MRSCSSPASDRRRQPHRPRPEPPCAAALASKTVAPPLTPPAQELDPQLPTSEALRPLPNLPSRTGKPRRRRRRTCPSHPTGCPTIQPQPAARLGVSVLDSEMWDLNHHRSRHPEASAASFKATPTNPNFASNPRHHPPEKLPTPNPQPTTNNSQRTQSSPTPTPQPHPTPARSAVHSTRKRHTPHAKHPTRHEVPPSTPQPPSNLTHAAPATTPHPANQPLPPQPAPPEPKSPRPRGHHHRHPHRASSTTAPTTPLQKSPPQPQPRRSHLVEHQSHHLRQLLACPFQDPRGQHIACLGAARHYWRQFRKVRRWRPLIPQRNQFARRPQPPNATRSPAADKSTRCPTPGRSCRPQRRPNRLQPNPVSRPLVAQYRPESTRSKQLCPTPPALSQSHPSSQAITRIPGPPANAASSALSSSPAQKSAHPQPSP